MFASRRNISVFTPPLNKVLDFFTKMFKKGLGYSCLSTARSALSTYISIDGVPLGQHQLVKRFMKGVFNLRPSLPKYEVTWDTNIVLAFIKKLSPVRKLDLKMLTLKLVTLIALLTGQRCQTVHAIDLKDTTITKRHVKFRIKKLLKHSRPGKHLSELCIKAYAPDRRMCVVTVLNEYIKRTSSVRNSDQLLISYVKPHKPVTKATVARWIKQMLLLSGVDTEIFSAHSTRAAATSRAKFCQVPFDTILRTAGWSGDSTFTKYYNKDISQEGLFAKTIQNKACN